MNVIIYSYNTADTVMENSPRLTDLLIQLQAEVTIISWTGKTLAEISDWPGDVVLVEAFPKMKCDMVTFAEQGQQKDYIPFCNDRYININGEQEKTERLLFVVNAKLAMTS